MNLKQKSQLMGRTVEDSTPDLLQYRLQSPTSDCKATKIYSRRAIGGNFLQFVNHLGANCVTMKVQTENSRGAI